jgi:hypothetical protein
MLCISTHSNHPGLAVWYAARAMQHPDLGICYVQCAPHTTLGICYVLCAPHTTPAICYAHCSPHTTPGIHSLQCAPVTAAPPRCCAACQSWLIPSDMTLYDLSTALQHTTNG